MLSCLGFKKARHREDGGRREHEPLLPRYQDDTERQRQLHQKLHTYQMLRALSQGFMPSTEQAIANVRALLAADILNPDSEDDSAAALSDSGRALTHYTKQWLHQLIDLLRRKNSNDQLQDFIWHLAHARVSMDTEHIAERASQSRAKADAAAAWRSLQTVGSLLLTNSDVRLFVSDLAVVAREVLRDTAFALSEVSRDAGQRIEPSQVEQESLREPGKDAQQVVNQKDQQGDVLEHQAAAEVGNVISEGAARVAGEAERSIASKVHGREKDTLLYRLKQAVLKLRQRPNYEDSVSTLSLLLKRYLAVYSRAVGDTVAGVAQEGDVVERNAAADRAAKNFYGLVKSFGDPDEWRALEAAFGRVVEHGREDPQFDDLVRDLGDALQEMMTDPAFFDSAEERFRELREKARQLASGGSSLREDLDALLERVQSTFRSVWQDPDVDKLVKTSAAIGKILFPPHTHAHTNAELVADAINVFVPRLVRMVQHIPIPRLEISTPKADVLIENLVLEPGSSVNQSSFMPYRLRVETRNDLEIRKARTRLAPTSAVQTLVSIQLDGMSVKADELGYWLRTRPNSSSRSDSDSGIGLGFLLRLIAADEGIASFRLDERGVDVHVDIEVGRDQLEHILTLRDVRVRIHNLDWTVHKSNRNKILAFLFASPPLKTLIVRPLVRRALERRAASAIADALHFANRELLFARERLRAARVADPRDLVSFVRAVAARFVPPGDPDWSVRLAADARGRGAGERDVFKGVYTPGSLVKVWNEQAEQAAQRVREGEDEEGGWRNEVFDV